MKSDSSHWPEVPIGDMLSVLNEQVVFEDMVQYITITVKRRHGGLEARETLFGHEIKTKKQFKLFPGAFIISRVQCWHAAFAIVPDDIPSNMIASQNYDQFAISPKVDKRFFWWLSHSPYFIETVRSSASGVVIEKMVFNREAWLQKNIPLPPLDEQRRIVSHIEALATRINQALVLRKQTIEELSAFIDSELGKIISENKARWIVGVIPEFAEVNPSRSGQINLNPVDLVSFVPMSAVDEVSGTIARPQPKQYQEVSKGYTWFVDGDVIFARITPCMENGKSAIAQNLLNRTGFGSTEFHVIRPGDQILAEWIYTLTRSKEFRNDAASHFKGTAGQQRVPQSFLQNKEIPVPPLSEQRSIVAYLDSLQSRVDALRRLQAESQRELEALLPSILDRAFKGEL